VGAGWTGMFRTIPEGRAASELGPELGEDDEVGVDDVLSRG